MDAVHAWRGRRQHQRGCVRGPHNSTSCLRWTGTFPVDRPGPTMESRVPGSCPNPASHDGHEWCPGPDVRGRLQVHRPSRPVRGDDAGHQRHRHGRRARTRRPPLPTATGWWRPDGLDPGRDGPGDSRVTDCQSLHRDADRLQLGWFHPSQGYTEASRRLPDLHSRGKRDS